MKSFSSVAYSLEVKILLICNTLKNIDDNNKEEKTHFDYGLVMMMMMMVIMTTLIFNLKTEQHNMLKKHRHMITDKIILDSWSYLLPYRAQSGFSIYLLNLMWGSEYRIFGSHYIQSFRYEGCWLLNIESEIDLFSCGIDSKTRYFERNVETISCPVLTDRYF